jgi:SAM-dependent methyltransferase
MSKFTALERTVERYYTGRFTEHGASARGVDWNSEESQTVRFEQLLRIHEGSDPFSINDFGCGYGALASFLAVHGYDFTYRGFDLSEAMIRHARAESSDARVTFATVDDLLEEADYTVASGVFNVKLDIDDRKWSEYVIAVLRRLAVLSRRGFAFNMLTSYSQSDRMRDDLFYGDPRQYFDLCEREFSRHVALLHDYGLWEWTILVRYRG